MNFFTGSVSFHFALKKSVFFGRPRVQSSSRYHVSGLTKKKNGAPLSQDVSTFLFLLLFQNNGNVPIRFWAKWPQSLRGVKKRTPSSCHLPIIVARTHATGFNRAKST